MRVYKVIYGAKQKVFTCINKARAFRDKKRAKHSDIVISVTNEDIDPANKNPFGDRWDNHPYAAKSKNS